MNYLVFQQETTPKTGVLHWQGYVEWKAPRSGGPTEAKLLFGENWKVRITDKNGKENWVMNGRFFAARGSAEQNKAYCSKKKSAVEDTFEEYGTPATQGQRNDIKEACKVICEHKGSVEGWRKLDPYLVIQYGRRLQEYMKLTGVKEEKRARVKPTVRCFIGPSGKGKSKAAVDWLEKKDIDYYRLFANQSEGKAWWSGYRGQKTVFIDEFEPGSCFTTSQLFQIFDYGECRVKVYGEEVQLLATDFVITSNFHPNTWVKETERVTPWLRRVKEFFKIFDYSKKKV